MGVRVKPTFYRVEVTQSNGWVGNSPPMTDLAAAKALCDECQRQHPKSHYWVSRLADNQWGYEPIHAAEGSR